MTSRWKIRPANATWGDWGPDDQLGRLNLIDADKVKQGLAEAVTGKTFCLSLPLDYPGGQVVNKVRHPPVLKPVIRNGEDYFNYRWDKLDARHTDIGSDDMVTLYTQYSTQWDSLAHRGALFDTQGDGILRPVYYNGFSAGGHVALNARGESRAHALGIENMAFHGVQGRGVLVDLHERFGDYPRAEVGYSALKESMDEQEVTVEPGDILCLWTGLDRLIVSMQGRPDSSINEACAVLDGFDPDLREWLIDSGVAAVVSDNLAVEAIGKKVPPGNTGSNLPLHELCLFRLGVHLGELWYLADLAEWLRANRRNRFLLTAPPLRLPGAVGSPVTPVATV